MLKIFHIPEIHHCMKLTMLKCYAELLYLRPRLYYVREMTRISCLVRHKEEVQQEDGVLQAKRKEGLDRFSD